MLLLLIIAGLVVVLLCARWIVRQPPPARRKWLLYSGVGLLIVLALTGRLHWLVAAVGATLPLLSKLFALVRFVPLFTRVLHNFNFSTQGYANFQSRSLVLEINPLTGTMDGRILAGSYKGRRLSSLGKAELDALMEEFLQEDTQAAQLLQSYRKRHSRPTGNDGAKPTTTDVSRDEALLILGLKNDATRDMIIEAHRRLIQRLHPDRGGSAHLAALINQAKDQLLK